MVKTDIANLPPVVRRVKCVDGHTIHVHSVHVDYDECRRVVARSLSPRTVQPAYAFTNATTNIVPTQQPILEELPQLA
jgi:cytosine/adenosine deaminase-related metal-dependent hydrolase